MTSTALSIATLRELYAKMLLARIVDDHARQLYSDGYIHIQTSSHGYEAAQVGSAACIEVGTDFTLPYYRDLGVVLTIGMTPYEVFRTYVHTYRQNSQQGLMQVPQTHTVRHWGYHKHNTVTDSAPVATQFLHAAGIAFASKLRKAAVVTVAYCDDKTTTEPDFLEGLCFAAQHQLPAVFICEQDRHLDDIHTVASCTQHIVLPDNLSYQRIDGTDIVQVNTTMRMAMQHARDGHGPTLIEMDITRSLSNLHMHLHDPLVRCQHSLRMQDAWDDEWANQLSTRIRAEVQRAMHDALRDIPPLR